MTEFLLANLTALWLGILTSVSPCPLATNIAAVSYVGRRVGHPRAVLLSGVLYTLGRMALYVGLGIVLATFLLSVPRVSFFLQRNMNRVLGPLLVLVGLALLEVIRIPGLAGPAGSDAGRRLAALGTWGAMPLGFLFALSFCPISAALFFGTLLPLSVTAGSRVAVPALYGLGTGLPVLLVAVIISRGVGAMAGVVDRIGRVESWARRITAGLFIGVGLHYTAVYLLGMPIGG